MDLAKIEFDLEIQLFPQAFKKTVFDDSHYLLKISRPTFSKIPKTCWIRGDVYSNFLQRYWNNDATRSTCPVSL